MSPQYTPKRLHQYPPQFVQVAEELFRRVEELARQVANVEPVRREGSFTIRSQKSDDAVLKIVIYDPNIKKPTSDWPPMRDGVYVWVRMDGRIGDAVWGNPSTTERRWLERFSGNTSVHIGPNPEEFTILPIMAGDDLGEIAAFIVACCARVSSTF